MFPETSQVPQLLKILTVSSNSNLMWFKYLLLQVSFVFHSSWCCSKNATWLIVENNDVYWEWLERRGANKRTNFQFLFNWQPICIINECRTKKGGEIQTDNRVLLIKPDNLQELLLNHNYNCIFFIELYNKIVVV